MTTARRPVFRLRRFSAIARKETLQIFRDPSTLLVAFVLPVHLHPASLAGFPIAMAVLLGRAIAHFHRRA